jgi:SAM-dependent methyltransferase
LASVPTAAAENSFGCGNPLAFAGINRGDVVLDLGSGAGLDLLLASEKVGPTGKVIGVDMTDAMLAKARENIRRAGLDNVEVRKGLIEQLPLENSSVDWVVSNCVLNLSPEKPRVFAEIARVLKPGGQMLVADIVAKDLPAELRKLSAFVAACAGGAISEEEYVAGLAAAGLTDVKIQDRLIYDASQLAGFVADAFDEDPHLAKQLGSCGCAGDPRKALREYAASFAGKIWSARVYARKPS